MRGPGDAPGREAHALGWGQFVALLMAETVW